MATTQINDFIVRLMTGQRTTLRRLHPLFKPFEPYRRPSPGTGGEVPVPESAEAFLTATGYGDIAEVLSFRAEWMHVIDRGELAGHVIFAQDDGGNHYACSTSDKQIFFVSRCSPEYALIATSLGDFLEELERRRFDLEGWTNGLELKAYNWE